MSFSLGIISLFLVGVLLIIGKSFFIPLIFASFISALIISFLHKLKKKKINLFFRVLILLIIVFVILIIIFFIFNFHINSLIEQFPSYQEQLIMQLKDLIILIKEIPIFSNFDFQEELILSKINFSQIIQNVFLNIRGFSSNFFIILIYCIFIISQKKFLIKKIKLLLKVSDTTLEKIGESIEQYIYAKTIMSFFTGLFSYYILLFFNVDFALFWSFFIFLLNYIPIFGSIMAVVITSTFIFIQFASFDIYFISLILLALVQIIFGGILEPKVIGNRLKINPFIIVISIIIFGKIWGIMGMLLSIPMVSILRILSNEVEILSGVKKIFD